MLQSCVFFAYSSCGSYPQRLLVVVVSRVGLILADIIGVAVTVAKTRQGAKMPHLGGSQRSLGNVLLYDGTPPLLFIPRCGTLLTRLAFRRDILCVCSLSIIVYPC